VSFPDEVKDALGKAGIGASSLDRIRLAQRGVVGKATYVAGATVLGLASLALTLRDPLYLLIVGVLILLVFVFYFAGSLWFAHRHPGVALLEGADLIQWRQMEMTARDLTEVQRLQESVPQILGKQPE
jgi:hypothetical protein